VLELRRHGAVHAFVHVTGGGIPANLARVLPADCDGVVQRGRWPEPRIFGEIATAGDVPAAEMEHVFNLGLGMLALVPPRDTLRALDALRAAGHEAWEVGEVVDGNRRVTLLR
jgi:phosphoribosylformylglycinamidine cyclo-ligase